MNEKTIPEEPERIQDNENPPASAAKEAARVARRLNHAVGPIAAGAIIDLVDLATLGPIGIVLGLPIGGLAGYWKGSALGLSRRASLPCALAAGVYCTIPFTEPLPLATIVGAFVRFKASGEPPGQK